MSRIGKNKIIVPAKTEVKITGQAVSVKGPLGELSREFPAAVKIEVVDGHITVTPVGNMTVDLNSLWGTVASHIKNMVAGVNKAFEKKLILEGIGFKADVVGADIVFKLGFSHPVKIAIPKNLKVTSEKNIIAVSGIDKEFVGRYVAELRALKKPEPYKGKGMRYEKEVIRRKEGKKTV